MNTAALQPSLSRKIQILIVEDEMAIARDIRECLENLGYAVPAIATSGTTAIEIATQLRPDLVLMDIRLKGEMDGTQAAGQIWGNLQIPIVYASGHSDTPTLQRAKATAPFGYILKPIEERELFVTIETALQRFRIERELQAREKWLATILQGISDGVIVVDPQGQVKLLNLAAAELTGWAQAEATGKAIAQIMPLIHEQTRLPVENPATAALQAGTAVYLSDRILLIAKDGREKPIGDSAAPLRDDSGAITGAVIVFRNRTERQLLTERNLAIERAEQLESQMAELERLNQLKDDFLSQISHEMRTPLTNIKMSIQMLEVVLGQQGLLTVETNPSADSITRYLRILRNQCQQELSLVNDLLDMQHLDAETYQLELTEIYLQDLIPRNLESFQDRIVQRQQSLQIAIAPDLPPLVSDWSSLFRTLSELVNNACKYIPPGGQITVTAQLSASDRIQLQVSNTGVEIPVAELPRVFDRFYRVPNTDRWQQGGTGLGLALIQKLVTYLGGSIRVESGAGQTCFIVELVVGKS